LTCPQEVRKLSIRLPIDSIQENEMEEKVRDLIENEIRPALQMDGGDIELVGFEGNNVQVRLRGACSGCPGAAMTLKMGVERRLKQVVPELGEVIAV